MLLEIRRMRSGAFIPFATMAKADQLQDGWRITCANGETETCSDIDMRIALEMTLQSSFPAAPGTYLVHAMGDGEGDWEIHRTAVLGWGMYADGQLRPITLDAELEDKYFVKHPDGRVESSHSLDRWGHEDAWFEEQRNKA